MVLGEAVSGCGVTEQSHDGLVEAVEGLWCLGISSLCDWGIARRRSMNGYQVVFPSILARCDLGIA